MSIKYGALAGLALAAFGILGLAAGPVEPLSAQAYRDAAPDSSALASQERLPVQDTPFQTALDGPEAPLKLAAFRVEDEVATPLDRGAIEKQTEGEGEAAGEGEVPTASITFSTAIRDKEGLLPLHDWVGLFRFVISFPEDNFAPRWLSKIRFRVHGDGRDPADLGYGVSSGNNISDLLEFGLFWENFADDANQDGFLDRYADFLLYRWPATGAPPATVVSVGSDFTEYELDFIGNGNCTNPDFPIDAGPDSLDLGGYSYIVGVRTSATWRSQNSMAVTVTSAEIVEQDTCNFYRDDEGAPRDTYAPNFYDGEAFEDASAYSASFTVWDVTGLAADDPDFTMFWNQPNFTYTPLGEWSRPRWNKFDQLMDVVGAETLQMRTLLSYEQWEPVIGINLQSSAGMHFDGTAINWSLADGPFIALLTEVNVILTDIGADPYGSRGNGGFDPRSDLDTLRIGGVISGEFGRDSVFNGISVWHDTNNNGIFDAPTGSEDGGITYNGDFPMEPDFDAFYDGYSWQWQYVPLPPDGGDPWWKISMRLFGFTDHFNAEDEGVIERVPTALPSGSLEDECKTTSEMLNDYFVVVRLDSGMQDVSLVTGDGDGAAMGADFRAFIEPRHFNPVTGHEDGGIFADSQIPQFGERRNGSVISAWQDDALWGAVEPWWPQRTTNQFITKPARLGVDVHDLHMTYESDSDFRLFSDAVDRVTGLMFFGPCLGYSPLQNPYDTDSDRWYDPFGLIRNRFLNGHTPTTLREGWFYQLHEAYGPFDAGFYYDDVGDPQYAYETVPFLWASPPLLDARSAAFPHPHYPPDVPWYFNWPGSSSGDPFGRASDWGDLVTARLLDQKLDIVSTPTPMLGVNLAGIADPYIQSHGNRVYMDRMTVAFWGPDFDPSDLMPLDSVGLNERSGVLLWEDVDRDGVFSAANAIENYTDFSVPMPGRDRPVPLSNLAWGNAPELIDLDGDGVAEDMNGDGLIDVRDRAWVVALTPQDNWEVPPEDGWGTEFPFELTLALCCGDFSFSFGFTPPEEGEAQIEGEAADLSASRDVTLYESGAGDTANGAGQYFFVGPNAKDEERRAMLYFDIRNNIPVDATITSAELQVFMSDPDQIAPKNVYLTRVLKDWGQGASNADGNEEEGTDAVTSDATWLHRFYPQLASKWDSPGGDFVSPNQTAQISGAMVISGVGAYVFQDETGFYTLRQQVQDWLDLPDTNFGWCLIGDEDPDNRDLEGAKRFDSSESPDTSHRPVLRVKYTLPSTGKRSAEANITAKSLGPEPSSGDTWETQPGDDLFVTVNTSDQARRFESFRAVVPATLPERVQGDRTAGIHFLPALNTAPSALVKSNPEEDPVQDFYGADMMTVNVPARIVDLTGQSQVLYSDGTPLPTLGIDVSTNGASKTLATGQTGTGGNGLFAVSGAAWGADAFAGDWLVDSAFESFEIMGNTKNRIELRSGRPADGAWRIVEDPSFLEQIVVEFYNTGTHSDFSPQEGLLPLDIDQEMSGVAIYRDNDSSPRNRNGVFDPAVDIPVLLDAQPEFYGAAGGQITVKFVFSSPGTDEVPKPLAEQTRHRQWVPETFGGWTVLNGGAEQPQETQDTGPDFFVVIRARETIPAETDFRMGIVSWGPNTPTEPDPDTWAGLPDASRNDFVKFTEFPWAQRGLGFITFFKDPPISYFMDGARAGMKIDNLGVNWIRSHGQQKVRSGLITVRERSDNPYSVVIKSASVSELYEQIPTETVFPIAIAGSGFGANPEVELSGYEVKSVQVNATGTKMRITIGNLPGVVPRDPVVLFVRNSDRNEEAKRKNLFHVIPGVSGPRLLLTGMTPQKGTAIRFPVTIRGENIGVKADTAVLFNETLMSVVKVKADGTNVQAGYPAGGLPQAGLYDVTVRDRRTGMEDILIDGFEFTNKAQRPGCGCAPTEDTDAQSLSGDALFFAVMALAFMVSVRLGRRHRRDLPE